MGTVLAVAIGGALGAVFRFLISKFIQNAFSIDFPLGTMVVNFIGAFLIGFLFATIVEKIVVPPEVRALLITGFLGGLTTFSTFSYESFTLLKEGETIQFTLYFLGTNILGLFLTFLGFLTGRLI